MNLEAFKNKQRLIRTAEIGTESESKLAMALLRSINSTYHWCPDWDFMVICDEDLEYRSCLCKSKKRDV